MCVTWKSCIFERKIQCRVKISCHCWNVKHRWVRFSFSPARAWRGTNLCSSLWRFVNSLPCSALLLLKSSSCVEIVAEANSYRSALFRRDRLQPLMGKQCAPLLFCGSGSGEEKKGGRGRERTRERSAVWRVRLLSVSSARETSCEKPRETQTGLIMVIVWNRAQSSRPPVASCGGEKTSCRPSGPVCRVSSHTFTLFKCYFLTFFFFIPPPCFSSPSAHLNRRITKLELGLIWEPQIDCILQPGCRDLWWKWIGMVWAVCRGAHYGVPFFFFFFFNTWRGWRP